VPSDYFLSPKDEKARYDQHKNYPHDKRYRRFLNKVYAPMQERIEPESCGIDFGSGPGPTLSVMFKEAGHSMVDYDPFYDKHAHLLKNKYDFITITEVVEHLYEPIKELDMLWKMLKDGGWMGVMTDMSVRSVSFKEWHYKDDPTHVCFFSHTTLEWVAARWNAEIIFTNKNVALFKKHF